MLHYVSSSDIDICVITESWIKPEDHISIAELQCSDYNFEFTHRTNRCGRGTAVLYKNTLNIKLTQSNELNTFEYSLWKITNKHIPSYLLVVYRPPSSQSHPTTVSNFTEEFSTLLTNVLAECSNIIICGDFNIHYEKVRDPGKLMFDDLLNNFGLKQHVNVPTHVSGHTLDFIITTEDCPITLSSPIPDFYISDHCFVSCKLTMSKPEIPIETVKYRRIKKINKTDFAIDIQAAIKRLLECNTDNVNTLVDLYDTSLTDVLNKHAPIVSKRVPVRKKVPWFDTTAGDLKRQRRKLERKWRSSKTEHDRLLYRKACDDYRLHLDTSRFHHINDLIKKSEGNTKKLFNIVKDLTGHKNTLVLPDTIPPETLAQDLADFFVKKITDIRTELDVFETFIPDQICESSFTSFVEVPESTITTILKSSKSATCTLDPIPTEFLKEFDSLFVPILTRIVNLSLLSATFASDWKDAIVLPTIKKASLDKNLLKNYRPISNLSFLSKLTEKAALSQIWPYIDNNSLLPSYQNAYRKFHSTETAIVKLFNDILWSMERQEITSLITIDLSAAFDTVNHDTLLLVLNKCFGFKEAALSWFESYLRPRQMHVVIPGFESQPCDLPFSVPQGSVAGPVLYTMYASTMQSVVVNQNISGYADDHAIYNSFKPQPSIEKKVIAEQEKCLRSIRLWMSQNRLKMNDEKTEFMLIGHRAQLQKCKTKQIKVGPSSVSISDHIKYLGVLTDTELSFKQHIISKSKIAALNLRNIRCLRKYLTEASCKTLVQALVMSHLDYSNAIFTDLPSTTMEPAQRIQNFAAKVILNRQKYDSATDALYELHWLPIHQRCKFKTLLLVYKCLNDQAPEYLKNLLVKQPFIRTTRSSSVNSNKLIVPFVKCSTFAARSFAVTGPKYWNPLSNELKSCKDTDHFRKQLMTFLFSEYLD